MAKETFNQNRSVPQLIEEKDKIERELILERAKLASQAKKNSPKIKGLRRKIARVETTISALVQEAANKL